MKKRMMAMLMTAILIIASVPFTAFAEEAPAEVFGGEVFEAVAEAAEVTAAEAAEEPAEGAAEEPENTEEADSASEKAEEGILGKKAEDPKPDYLTFTANEDISSVTFNYSSGTDVQYSTDKGTTWSAYTKGTKITLVNAGDTVSFKGNGVKTDTNYHFSMTGSISASGSVTSLTDGNGGNPAVELKENCYSNMFNGCTSLTTAPALPAKTLAEKCYDYMFKGCTSLTTAPALPAETLATYCYRYMFNGCTSLTTAPVLPAETLASYCYESMFEDCNDLTKAPELPAAELATYCYRSMFSGCTALETAPSLPAERLAESCYSNMFSGCESLKTAPALPVIQLGQQCYQSMFKNCTSLETAPSLPATELTVGCYYQMFSGCESLKTAPSLPATELAVGCYNQMFSGCKSLEVAPALPATQLEQQCYLKMFNGCEKLNHVSVSFREWTSGATTDWLTNVAANGIYECPNELDVSKKGANNFPEGWEKLNEVTVTTWAGLQDAIGKAGTTETKICLGNDLRPESATPGEGDNKQIEIKNSANIILDLNGYTLDRGLKTAVNGGYLIYMSKDKPTLTITDSSLEKTGTITGGNSKDMYGGAIYVYDGILKMEGGTIEGNVAGRGGGVHVRFGSFTLTGGTIANNKASTCGGVSVEQGTFTMTGGMITGNQGGVLVIGSGTFTMTGGTITENEGYGVSSSGTITVGGKANVTGNYEGTGDSKTAKDVYLTSDKMFTIGIGEEAPVKGMSIGVKTSTAPTENNPVRISTNGTADDLQYVFADDAQLEVAFNTGKGCLELRKTTPKYTVTFDSQGGSEVAAQTVSKGEKAVKPADPTKTDKIFAGWYKDAGCTAGQKYDFETPVTADFTLYAKWEEKQVTITYLGFGGAPFLEIGQPVGLPAESWPRPDEEPGYVFDWWCADEACTEKWDFETLIREDTTLYSKWKKAEYTVTFDSQGGSTVAPQNALYEEKVRNPEPAPEKEGFAFGGWYKEKECRTAWNFAQDTVQQDMTLYARWIKNEEKKATVGGTVTEKGSGSVAGAAVELYLGTVKAAATVTDNEGHYKFDNVPTGTYNIVVTATGDKIKTVMVNVNEAGEFSADVELPKEDVSSKVEHKGEKQEDEKSDVSQTVVGGLDKIAEKMAQPNQKVTIKLTVEPKTDIDTPTQKDIKKEAGTERKVEFLDLSLMMQVGAQSEKNIGDENDQLLTIVIPFDFTGVNVTGMMILRNHGGKVEKLTASPNADGEYFAVDRTAGTLTIYAKKFSEYALAYEPQQKPDPDPSSDSDSEPVFTGTWNNPVQNGAWKQDANGIWSYTTTQVFRNTWGYIVNPYAGEGQNKADWFYFDQYGHMLTGWQLIGGKWYYLNPVKDGTFGACLLGPGKTPDGYEIDASGAWTGR